MMVVDTLYKPNINADAKHISFVLLKFLLIRLMFFKYLFGKNVAVPNLRNSHCLKKDGGSVLEKHGKSAPHSCRKVPVSRLCTVVEKYQ